MPGSLGRSARLFGIAEEDSFSLVQDRFDVVEV